MMELTTQLYKINFKQLIDNATNRKFWERTWEIFRYGNIAIIFQLQSIDIQNNKLICQIQVKDKTLPNTMHNWYCDNCRTTTIVLSLAEEHFNQTALEKELVGKVDDLLQLLSQYSIRQTRAYQDMIQAEDDLMCQLQILAEDFLDSHGVSNDAIREAYVDMYQQNNKKNLAEAFLIRQRVEGYVPCRATFAYIMGLNEKAESIIAESQGIECDDILEEAATLKQQLEDDDLQKYEENLESI